MASTPRVTSVPVHTSATRCYFIFLTARCACVFYSRILTVLQLCEAAEKRQKEADPNLAPITLRGLRLSLNFKKKN